MALATGDYLIFLDSDDRFEENMLEKMFNRIDQTRADICICGAGAYDVGTHRLQSASPLRISEQLLGLPTTFRARDIADHIFTSTNPAAWNKLFRADFIREQGLRFQSLHSCNDLYFTRGALVLADSVTVVDQWLVTYRRGVRGGLTVSDRDGIKCLDDAMCALRDLLIDRRLMQIFDVGFRRALFDAVNFQLESSVTAAQWASRAEAITKMTLGSSFRMPKNRELLKDYPALELAVCSGMMPACPDRFGPNNSVTSSVAAGVVGSQNPGSITRPKVSVIIPVYNTMAYLEECVGSVLRQSLSDIEVICVDDGSTDESLQILSRLAGADERVKIATQNNRGLSATRNHGLQLAHGEYVMFLDSDDVLVWCALEHLVGQSEAHGLDDLFCGGVAFFDPPEVYHQQPQYYAAYHYKGTYNEPCDGQNLLCAIAANGDFSPSVCLRLFRRGFLVENALQFIEGMVHEDNVFTLQSLSKAKKAWVWDEPLYLRRVRPSSIMSSSLGWESVRGYYRLNLEVERMLDAADGPFKVGLEQVKSLVWNGFVHRYRAVSGQSPRDLVSYEALGGANLLDLAMRLTYERMRAPDGLENTIALLRSELEAANGRLEETNTSLDQASSRLAEVLTSRTWRYSTRLLSRARPALVFARSLKRRTRIRTRLRDALRQFRSLRKRQLRGIANGELVQDMTHPSLPPELSRNPTQNCPHKSKDRQISFLDFMMMPGRIEWLCEEKRDGDALTNSFKNFIEFDAFLPTHDVIASTISTFCGSAYSSIYFDLVLHQAVVTRISGFTSASVTARRVIPGDETRTQNGNVALCFSGGFDSLAAHYLVPSNTSLVSIDWGGWFTRETQVFETYPTHIVRTDVRRSKEGEEPHLSVDQNSWEFMGFGAMLYRDYLELDTVVFGTILESYLDRLDSMLGGISVPFPFPEFGLVCKIYVGALTEVGTAFVCEYYGSDDVGSSLTSVAAVGSTKLYRKQLLIHVAKLRYGRVDTPLPEVLDIPVKALAFGEYVVDDFLAFYIRKKFGAEVVELLCAQMTPEAVELCDSLGLQFYERVMPELVNLSSGDEARDYFSKLNQAGIVPWDDTDWAEFITVIDLLRKHHPEIASITSPSQQVG